MATRILILAVAVLAAAGWSGVADDLARRATATAISSRSSTDSKHLLGPIATISETESGLDFEARVDTGAAYCSLHALEIRIDGGSPDMHENVGKRIRFRTVNRRGQSIWLERPIAHVAEIRTSEDAEWRYLVPLTLACAGVEREVLVSLNDRSQMHFALLLGRNLLAGQFLVDVDL
jgi:hypothetical protein